MAKPTRGRGWINSKPQTWLLFSHGEESQYAGNSGYDELPENEYRYDAHVDNHDELDVGDKVVIVGKRHLIGSAVIERIERWEGTHTFRRCPTCRSTRLKTRKQGNPYYCEKCGDKEGFPQPVVETVKCICYRASYGRSFAAAPSGIPAKLASALTSGQQSIRKIDPDLLSAALAEVGMATPH